MKLHAKRWNGRWAVWRNKESSRYAVPVTAKPSPKQAMAEAIAYLDLDLEIRSTN